MNDPVQIFLDFNLPNTTTWFYFSFLLAMALFFKFSRLLSIRNWDVVTLFMLVPGLLLLQGARHPDPAPETATATDVAQLVLQGARHAAAAPLTGAAGAADLLPMSRSAVREHNSLAWYGYLWLLCGSAYLVLRCLVDLTLVRRPALGPNLNPGGLMWLAGTMFICLAAVAYRPPPTPPPGAVPASTTPVAVSARETKAKGTETVGQSTAPLELAQTSIQNSLGPSFWLRRTFAILCHLSVVAGLIVIGSRHFQDTASGMAAATFYLLLPYTGYYVGQAHHVWPMSLMVWAIVLYRKPSLAGLFIGLAAGTVFFPALVLPIWLSFYWRRGVGRFLLIFFVSASACLAVTAFDLWLKNDLSSIITNTLALPDWQPWKMQEPTQEGFWMGVHWAYRLPVFIVYLALVIMTAFWPNPKNLAHVLALSALVLIGIQFWYAYQGGVYILWYLPLVLLLVFRPNLAAHRPGILPPGPHWLTSVLRRLRLLPARLLEGPDTLVRAR
jgi:hypothetical protein